MSCHCMLNRICPDLLVNAPLRLVTNILTLDYPHQCRVHPRLRAARLLSRTECRASYAAPSQDESPISNKVSSFEGKGESDSFVG